MKIIGITGKKSNGKDTFANYYKSINKDTIIITTAFAKPIKDICKLLFSLNNEQLHGGEKETNIPRLGLSPRVLMQKIGTELFRGKFTEVFPELNVGENIWTSCLENNYIIPNLDKDITLIITDVRFENEAELVKRYNGTIINIIRNEGIGNIKDLHSSENNDLYYDTVVENNGTLDDFYKIIDKIKL